MTEYRIIKKYPNRRLYDTGSSCYVTLEDVRRLVVKEVPIKVVDARTEEDITHSIMLQIIVEQEEKGAALLTIEGMQNMIRSYGDSLDKHTQVITHVAAQNFKKLQNLQSQWLECWAKSGKPKI